jgi:hypothetical protein
MLGPRAVRVGWLFPEGEPILDSIVIAAQPRKGDEIDLLIFTEIGDERGQLLRDGIIPVILEHCDLIVVGCVGTSVGFFHDVNKLLERDVYRLALLPVRRSRNVALGPMS